MTARAAVGVLTTLAKTLVAEGPAPPHLLRQARGGL